ncbi:MAG: multidrug transporter, partial [Pseudomonadota bacterium]
MSDWILSIEGTLAGERLALVLALLAAFLHAVFGALQKGSVDPWLSRSSIDVACLVFAAPVALFVVPWPVGQEWLVMLGAVIIMFFYKVGMALAYARGAFTVVYPVVRGTGPLFTIAGAYILFRETLTGTQWLGVALLSGAILSLAAYNLRHVEIDRATLVPALLFAFGTGALVALYTTYGAFGIRTMPDPFTFLAWFF